MGEQRLNVSHDLRDALLLLQDARGELLGRQVGDVLLGSRVLAVEVAAARQRGLSTPARSLSASSTTPDNLLVLGGSGKFAVNRVVVQFGWHALSPLSAAFGRNQFVWVARLESSMGVFFCGDVTATPVEDSERATQKSSRLAKKLSDINEGRGVM